MQVRLGLLVMTRLYVDSMSLSRSLISLLPGLQLLGNTVPPANVSQLSFGFSPAARMSHLVCLIGFVYLVLVYMTSMRYNLPVYLMLVYAASMRYNLPNIAC